MPSGVIHSTDSIIIGMVGGIVLTQANVTMDKALAFSAGAWAGILLSPDLDQDGLTISETAIIRRVPVLGWLWFMYWFPYAKAIPHRSIFSHLPGLGTLIRLLYLFPLWYFLPLPPFAIAAFFIIGLTISDSLHWLRDNV